MKPLCNIFSSYLAAMSSKTRLGEFRLSPARRWLVSAMALGVLTIVLADWLILGAYGRWQQAQDIYDVRCQEYARLQANLSVRKQITRHLQTLGAEAFASDTDESAVSDFLSDLETKCRRANLLLSSMRPLAVKKSKSFRTFPVRLAITGSLADVSRFCADVSSGQAVTGIEGFSIRGVHGSDNVECQLSVWMVRLSGAAASRPATASTSGPSTRSARDKR